MAGVRAPHLELAADVAGVHDIGQRPELGVGVLGNGHAQAQLAVHERLLVHRHRRLQGPNQARFNMKNKYALKLNLKKARGWPRSTTATGPS